MLPIETVSWDGNPDERKYNVCSKTTLVMSIIFYATFFRVKDNSI